jgi:hypothetical protein
MKLPTEVHLDIPFYPGDNGDGANCVQAAVRSAIAYFLGKRYTFAELDKKMHRNPGKDTTLQQAAAALVEENLTVRGYGDVPLDAHLDGEAYLRKLHGEQADPVIARMDLDAWHAATKAMLESGTYTQKIMTTDDLRQEIANGKVMLVAFDSSQLYHTKEEFFGHLVALTGYNEEGFFYHETHPPREQPNRFMTYQQLNHARDVAGTDHEVMSIGRKP